MVVGKTACATSDGQRSKKEKKKKERKKKKKKVRVLFFSFLWR
jgi:hypothetical protein